jgi:EmrB/QacA subfamily drug resistance transporter
MSTSPRHSQLAFSMLMLILVLAALDQTILSTALPVMARELHGGWPLAWVFSSYLLASTVVIVLYGRLADVVGTKHMLLLSLGLFLLGSLACGASTDLAQLILARALQGAGGGGLMTLTMLSVVALYTPEQRGRYQGLLGAAYGVSTMFGPLLGGALVEHLSWHWAFWLNVPLAVLAWLVLAQTLPVTARDRHARALSAIDWWGALLLTVALVSLLLATQRDKLSLPEAVSVWVLLGAGVASTAAFLWRQRAAQHPLLPLSLFQRPAYAATSLIAVATGVALYAAVVLLPQYLQVGLHMSPTASAWHLLPLMAGLTTAAVLSGRLLRNRRPPALLARTACVLMLLSFGLIIATLHWLPLAPLALSASLLPLGLGLGLLFPIVTVVSQRTSPAQYLGIATAAPVMLRSLGGAAGVALLAALVASGLHQALQTPPALAADALALGFAHALQPAFAWAAVAALLAGLMTRWLPMALGPAPVAAPGPAAGPASRHGDARAA